MVLPARISLFAGIGLAAVLFTACAEEPSGARTTLAELPGGTNYVVVTPVPTTTTTTVPVSVVGGDTDPNEQSYTVQAGDGLSRIASLHGLTSDELVLYNGWPEGATHVFMPGEIVRIPPGSKVPGATTPDSSSPDDTSDAGSSTETTPPGIACEHTVVAGDNQGRVANQYDVTLEELAAANAGNPDWNYFPIGSTIHIPEGGNC
jgi:LysM repeat protein